MLTHAFGARYDAPVPLWLFVVGGAAVVVLSFALMYRRDVSSPGPVTPDLVIPPRGSRLAAVSSVGALGLLVAAGLLGSQEVAENILPTMFWVVLWVVVPLAVGLVGDFTGPVNPFAALARAADAPRLRRMLLGRPDPLTWNARLGWWVGVAAFLVVVVGELVVNRTATLPAVTAAGLVVYATACAVGGLLFGAQAWTVRAEMFTVVLATWGRLGWFRFRAPGRRGFGGGLDVPFEASPGRLVGVLLLLVSVTFDGLLSTPQWGAFAQALPSRVAPGTPGFDGVAIGVLLGLTVGTMLVFGAFAVLAGRAARRPVGALTALTGLLPSLLPIAYGYLLAHYLQYVAINGQLLLPLIGNPVGSDSWPVHLPYPFNDDYEVATGVLPTSVTWYLQLVVIVAAHVVAVVLAHRHLTIAAPAPVLARRSEWPWLVAMVAYTTVSLWLLAQPLLAEEGGGAPERAAAATLAAPTAEPAR